MGFLTDLKIRTASPSAKEYLLADGDGLYLRVRATSKSWLYRYKSDEKQVKIGLGAYPTITFAMARAWLESASKDRVNLETAQHVREAVQHVYQHAVNTDVLGPVQNFVNNRTGGLPTPRGRHYAAITDPQLLDQLEARKTYWLCRWPYENSSAIRTRGFTQAEAAKRMGLNQPKVSSLLRGKFSNFSERKLMDCLNRLGYDIEIRVREAAEPVGRLVLTRA